MNINEVIEKLISKHLLAIEDLTEKQFAEAIRQACACGDFQRLINPTGGQQVIYIPFAREQELLNRISNLEKHPFGSGCPIAPGEDPRMSG